MYITRRMYFDLAIKLTFSERQNIATAQDYRHYTVLDNGLTCMSMVPGVAYIRWK